METKLLLITAMAGIMLTGCVNEESALDSQSKQKITFDSPVLYNNVNGRANVYGEIGSVNYGSTVSYTYPREENFIIYAVAHENNFSGWANGVKTEFDNTAISYDMNVDGWAPKTEANEYYFWENGKLMSFAACSPADLEQGADWDASNRSYGATGLIIKDFKIASDASKQYDLLFSTRVCNQTSKDMLHSANYYSGIPIKFQHALSSIRFSISNTSEETVNLTGISISNAKYFGTFNENIIESASDYTLYDKEQNVTPQWTVEDDVITSPYIAFEGNIPFYEAPQYVSSLVAEVGTESDICNQLLLMPQDLSDDVLLTVHYTVNGNPNTKEIILNTQKESVNNTTINKWEIGKRYTYRLVYSSSSSDKDKIYFSPSTDEWTDVDIIIIEL